jgi:hypothetical protein
VNDEPHDGELVIAELDGCDDEPSCGSLSSVPQTHWAHGRGPETEWHAHLENARLHNPDIPGAEEGRQQALAMLTQSKARDACRLCPASTSPAIHNKAVTISDTPSTPS